MTGIYVSAFIIIIVVIGLTIFVTLKAYTVTYSEKIDQIPDEHQDKSKGAEE